MKKKTITVKPVGKKPATTISNKVIKSFISKASMESADPFSTGRNVFSTQNNVSFASEQGRRGSEVLGLNVGGASAVILNTAVACKRSRHAVFTNPYAKRAVDVMVSNVVGAGHRMISAAPDAAFKKQVEDLWEEWKRFADTSGKLDFNGLEALAFRSMLEGGDCFVRLRTRLATDGFPVPLQLQIYEAEQVPVIKNEIISNNGTANKIIAGIQFDALDRPFAYHMYKSHPNELFLLQTGTGMATTTPVPADQIIHIHDVKRPNEVRGLPMLSQALIKLSDLDRYMDAELVRKKAVALIGGFIRQPADGNNGNNPFITPDADPNAVLNNEDSTVHIEALEAGSFPILPAGYDVTLAQPADVGGNFSQFMKHQLMMIAASLNETYEQLTGDMANVNDRSLRANMLEFKRIATNYQTNILVHQFCRGVFERWFDLAVISGALKIPAGMSDKDARKVTWVPDPWPYMNPLQEVNTQIAEIRAGLKSRSATIIERGGIPEEIDDHIKIDKDRENKLDLQFTTNAGILSNAGVVHSQDPTEIAAEDPKKYPPLPTDGSIDISNEVPEDG